ncbi:MAG: branched-chain amino acid ABC transporter permease [Rhodosalinus sp.]|uniref:branched-chain amino acid ABC transporter permease n=1 Tax=Rhodosalinus sp. TaxID=2047741 RepID=UPI00397B9B26
MSERRSDTDGASRGRTILLFALVAGLIIGTGFVQSWNNALVILNMGLVSAIMALGVNMQWGFAGLFNVGVMGFVALGGLAAVLVSMPPVPEAWAAGGPQIVGALLVGAGVIALAIFLYNRMRPGQLRAFTVFAVVIVGFFVYRGLFDPAKQAVESVDSATTGYLGGLGLPIVLAWPVGGLLAAGAAWVIGKVALGLRSDYLAIATLGIAEIVIAILKNEDWLSRGVKNVIGLPRPVPREVDLRRDPAFVEQATNLGLDPGAASSITVKLGYSVLFTVVLVFVLIAAQLALNSPWGRMMRAIRDNETAAEAMGKDVTGRHLQVFVLGSALLGLAGAMMTTLDGQLTPASYQPLRFTFLIWVMVIVGGSGNNLGAVLGGFLVWWLWVQVEPIGQGVMSLITAGMAEDSALRDHLMDSVAHMRLLTMGVIMLVMLRFAPRGLLPER